MQVTLRDYNTVIIKAPYSKEFTAAMRTIEGRRWNREDKVNEINVTNENDKDILHIIDTFNLSVSKEAMRLLAPVNMTLILDVIANDTSIKTLEDIIKSLNDFSDFSDESCENIKLMLINFEEGNCKYDKKLLVGYLRRV